MVMLRKDLHDYADKILLTDGGLETTLIFHQGIDLPEFASFDLLRRPEGPGLLRDYFATFGEIAKNAKVGVMWDTPTWRASEDWGQKLGYSSTELTQANQESVALLQALRQEYETETTPVFISGCIGPRADGYVPESQMTTTAAMDYHHPQIATLAAAGVDFITAATVNYIDEAIGMTEAAADVGIPLIISFTVETDGKLPTGDTLAQAITQVDATTTTPPIFFMINCAHPTHFSTVLDPDQAWVSRIRGIRANASRKSHAELNESTELDSGNPSEFGQLYRQLRDKLNHLQILGGCCGTDYRHAEAICQACLPITWTLLSQPKLQIP